MSSLVRTSTSLSLSFPFTPIHSYIFPSVVHTYTILPPLSWLHARISVVLFRASVANRVEQKCAVSAPVSNCVSICCSVCMRVYTSVTLFRTLVARIACSHRTNTYTYTSRNSVRSSRQVRLIASTRVYALARVRIIAGNLYGRWYYLHLWWPRGGR